MKLPQLSLRELFLLVVIAAIGAVPCAASDFDQRTWFDILSNAKAVTVLAAHPKENEALKGKTFKGEEATRIVTLASKVRRFQSLGDDKLALATLAAVQVEILTFDKRRVVAEFYLGGIIVTYNGKHYVTEFEKDEDAVKFLTTLGAKWPDETARD